MSNEQPIKINWRIINALRGFAALGVVINHSRGLLFSDAMMYAQHIHTKANWTWWEWLFILLIRMTNLGSEFVILFFVLSGFSIAHSLSNNVSIKGFYKRRLVRLYPTYIIGLLWALAVFWLVRFFCADVFNNVTEGNPPLAYYYHKFISLKNIVLSAVYIHKENYLTHQYWSLPLEVIFYLLAPFIIKKLRVWSIITVLLYIAAWTIYGIEYNDEDTSNLLLQFFADYNIYFLIGLLFYKYKDKLVQTFPASKAVFAMGAVAIFIAMVLVKGYVFHEATNKVTGLLSVVFTYWLMFGTMHHDIVIVWLHKIGNYSYTLYVTHMATVFSVKIITHHLGNGFLFNRQSVCLVFRHILIASCGLRVIFYSRAPVYQVTAKDARCLKTIFPVSLIPYAICYSRY